ncbi:hypothetical protein [Pseudoxanthomonas putridarboris]|uniref:Uncharacterized protein n=1 Tax=Pseudoxanthomonas putridarboris TaxID=752605 RepID=A0ABU9IWI1_9GAMM
MHPVLRSQKVALVFGGSGRRAAPVAYPAGDEAGYMAGAGLTV